jgi:hypothetical protein
MPCSVEEGELLPSQQSRLDSVTRRSVGRESDCAVEEGTKGRSTVHWQSTGSHRRSVVRKTKSRRMMRTLGDRLVIDYCNDYYSYLSESLYPFNTHPFIDCHQCHGRQSTEALLQSWPGALGTCRSIRARSFPPLERNLYLQRAALHRSPNTCALLP